MKTHLTKIIRHTYQNNFVNNKKMNIYTYFLDAIS